MERNLFSQGIGRWLTPESLPAWIAALVMAGGWFYTWYRGKIPPSKIVVFEATRTLLGKLPEAETRLSMAFNGREIESLAMIDLVVRNEGTSTIEDIDSTIEVNEQARILTVEPQAAPYGVTISCEETAPSAWAITMGHLNPWSLAKEQVRLVLFCEPEPDALQVQGGGKGWSLEFIGQRELEARRAKRQSLVARLGKAVAFADFGARVGALFSAYFLTERVFAGSSEGTQSCLRPLLFTGLVLVSWSLINRTALIMERLLKPYPD